jgi:transcriptional regulator with XRE-family HTH domain
MPATWDPAQFGIYLRSLMDAEGITDFAELSRRTGVNQTQFSNWTRGKTRPSRENLKKVAPALGLTSAGMLYVAAGLEDAEDVGFQEPPDFTVLPKEFQDLREVYAKFDAAGRGDSVLSAIRLVVRGLKDELAEVEAIERRRSSQPNVRPRRAG